MPLWVRWFSLENLQPKQNKTNHITKVKQSQFTMYNLKERKEELFQFVKQFNPLVAAVFLLDYKCWGAGTLILDFYHRRIKTIDYRKFYIFMDIFSFILFMCSAFFDILYLKYYKEPIIRETLETLFFVKYIEYFICARLSNSQHKKINCIVCLKKPKQQMLNPNQSMIKYCICVCKKCERLSDNCDACKFTILTHFR